MSHSIGVRRLGTGVIACSDVIHELADELRGDTPLQPRGIALLRRLLRDGGSELHARGALLLD